MIVGMFIGMYGDTCVVAPHLGCLNEVWMRGSQPMSFREMLRVILSIVTEFSLLSRPPIYCKLLFFYFFFSERLF